MIFIQYAKVHYAFKLHYDNYLLLTTSSLLVSINSTKYFDTESIKKPPLRLLWIRNNDLTSTVDY